MTHRLPGEMPTAFSSTAKSKKGVGIPRKKQVGTHRICLLSHRGSKQKSEVWPHLICLLFQNSVAEWQAIFSVCIYTGCACYSQKSENPLRTRCRIFKKSFPNTNTFSKKLLTRTYVPAKIIVTEAITICPSFLERDSRDFALYTVSVQRDGKEEY